MLITLGPDRWAEWNGGHYMNYYQGKRNYDCISFAWEKDKPTFMDAWNAFISHELEGVDN